MQHFVQFYTYIQPNDYSEQKKRVTEESLFHDDSEELLLVFPISEHNLRTTPMAKGEGCHTPKGFPVSLVNGESFNSKPNF